MMKFARIICATWMIGTGVFGASAAVSAESNNLASDRGRSGTKVQAAERQVALVDRQKARTPSNRNAAPVSANRVAIGKRPRNPGPTARGHSNQPRPRRNIPLASGNPRMDAANLSRARANPSPGREPAMPNAALRRAVAPPQNSVSRVARIGTVGGPAQGYSRLGGPPSGKAAKASALNGSELLRRR
jgi:hypothetical protein